NVRSRLLKIKAVRRFSCAPGRRGAARYILVTGSASGPQLIDSAKASKIGALELWRFRPMHSHNAFTMRADFTAAIIGVSAPSPPCGRRGEWGIQHHDGPHSPGGAGTSQRWD